MGYVYNLMMENTRIVEFISQVLEDTK